MRSILFLPLTLLTTAWLCCQAPTYEDDHFRLSDSGPSVHFANPSQGGRLIIQDTVDGFFQEIQALDMQIQMGRNVPEDEVLETYRSSLQSEVQLFSPRERALMKQALEEVYQTGALFQMLFPEKLHLIKVSGKHYGPSAFYTRQNAIIIPAAVLQGRQTQFLQGVMVHELAHIFSRYHPGLQQKCYEALGFARLEKPPVIPDPLFRQRLINPDGVSLLWTIPLVLEMDTVSVLPFTYTSRSELAASPTPFFDYLEFGLFALQPAKGNNEYSLRVGASGQTTLPPEAMNAYFERISRNTNYMIHPDELLAENLKLWYQIEKGQTALSDLGERGQTVLTAIRTILEKS